MDELLADAITLEMAKGIPRPLEGDVQTDLIRLAHEVQDNLTTPEVSALLRVLVERAPYSETLALCSRALWQDFCDRWLDVLNEAVSKGSLPRRLASREVVSAILAPIFLRALLMVDTEDVDDIDRLVRQALAGGIAIVD